MKKKKYKYLDPLVIWLAGGKLFEKRAGMKDAQDNQLCELEGRHITPPKLTQRLTLPFRISGRSFCYIKNFAGDARRVRRFRRTDRPGCIPGKEHGNHRQEFQS